MTSAPRCRLIVSEWRSHLAGIVRTNKRLERAAHRITLLQGEIAEFYANFHVSRDLLELRNLVQVAELIVRSAQGRHESRGLHFSRDYPQTDEVASPTVLRPVGRLAVETISTP